MSGRKINPWLKTALELGPVLVFFLTFGRLKAETVTLWGTEYGGFVLTTAIFVPVLMLSTLVLWRLTGRLSAMQVVTLVLVVVFGGLSVWFNDPRFFKMKVTLIYLLFAGALGFGLLRGQSYLALVMDEALPMAREGWMILTRRIALLFGGLAVANELIWRNLSDQMWVDFKTFGLPGVMFLFFMAQARLIEKYRSDDKSGG
ncbi:MAG: septation protein IspZ [Proteobacteria bacterium]|nr:septation protein IspZ [Pseudomonadota bacterium]MBS0573430.1 septation protein IspZ [Pseudomonadota bacterium]